MGDMERKGGKKGMRDGEGEGGSEGERQRREIQHILRQ